MIFSFTQLVYISPHQLTGSNINDSLVFSVRQIENYPTSSGDAPSDPIIITTSGVLSPDDPSLTTAPESQDGDVYEDFPDDEDREVQKPEVALQIAKEVRELGNKLFKEGKAEAALEKYQSRPFLLHRMIRNLNIPTESIRYLDVHYSFPDDSPPELKDSYDSLRTPLLLNSALAALKAQPRSTANAHIAVKSATRALEHTTLNATDKGEFTNTTVPATNPNACICASRESLVPSGPGVCHA